MYKSSNKESNEIKFRNILTGTKPLIVHGNGPSKITLNALSNYLARAWNEVDGCNHCKINQIELETVSIDDFPVVYMALFIEEATPFLEEFFEKIILLEYPKSKVHLFVHNNVKYHVDVVKKFMDEQVKDYLSVKEIKPDDEISEWKARDLSV